MNTPRTRRDASEIGPYNAPSQVRAGKGPEPDPLRGAEMVARCTFYSLVIPLNLPGEGGIPVHRIKPRVNIGRLSRTHAHFLQFCQPFSKQEWVIGWVAEEVKRVKRKLPQTGSDLIFVVVRDRGRASLFIFRIVRTYLVTIAFPSE
ncbi:hypothetical protein QQP08_017567 [Theobroma cacao]|nr:hypothetical protein QQP08_017567 [Theobroma cacao]